MTEPYLYFTYEQQPMLFEKPSEIITAYRVEDVLDAIEQIENRVAEGWYAAGYLSYESAPAFDPSFQVASKHEMPLLWFGIFRAPHMQEMPNSENDFFLSSWQPNISEAQYHQAIKQIKQWIAQGDTYQVNYTLRFLNDFSGDPWGFYQQLTRAQQAPYAVYADLGRYHILSASPELFFRFDSKRITTRPMKGTIKRGLTHIEDQNHYQKLQKSAKDRAENLMIVDLLRNDLSRIAQPNSVQVPELFTLEAYPTVWSMTSTITARRKPEITWKDMLRALFPCGSITGAPKIKTMQLINELETEAREVYCGAIGYLTPHGSGIFNVPIRTAWIDTKVGKAVYGAGGGITWDSTAKGEYREAWAKTACLVEERPSFQLLESILLKNGQYHLLSYHLRRLKQSAQYFQYDYDEDKVRVALRSLAKQHTEGIWKVRLLYSVDQEIRLEVEAIPSLPQKRIVRWAKQPINRNQRFLYHKTTYRAVYEQVKSDQSDVFDVLMYNQDGECTEFTIGNLVVEIDGIKWTPPVSCGLLSGTFRQYLLDSGEILERVLHKKEIKQATRIWLINSVRGWMQVGLED